MADQLFALYPETQSLSKEDMQDLLNDPAYFNAFFDSLQTSKERDHQLEAALTRNTAATEQNMQLRPELESLRSEAASTFQQAHELIQSWTALQAQQAHAEQRFDLSAQINRLKSATAAAEKESDALAASFQRGDVPEDEFVKQYKELRRAYHKRALQMDKAQQNRIG